MALIHHRASVTPGKKELLEAWLPSQPWAEGIVLGDKVGEYRFDDPAGEVGLESMLFATDDGRVVQLPVSYRGSPLEGAEAFLVGTMDHTELGQRWVYDACGDPVWAAALATAILSGGRQAQMYFEGDDGRVDVPARVQVRGSGSETSAPTIEAIDDVGDDGTTRVTTCGDVELLLPHVIEASITADETLDATWAGGAGILAALRHR